MKGATSRCGWQQNLSKFVLAGCVAWLLGTKELCSLPVISAKCVACSLCVVYYVCSSPFRCAEGRKLCFQCNTATTTAPAVGCTPSAACCSMLGLNRQSGNTTCRISCSAWGPRPVCGLKGYCADDWDDHSISQAGMPDNKLARLLEVSRRVTDHLGANSGRVQQGCLPSHVPLDLTGALL